MCENNSKFRWAKIYGEWTVVEEYPPSLDRERDDGIKEYLYQGFVHKESDFEELGDYIRRAQQNG